MNMKQPAPTVDFTEMANGSAEEYRLLHRLEQGYIRELPARLLAALRELETSLSGYRVSRLTHSLQSATRAHRAGESEEIVVAALLHDLGDGLAPLAHGEMAAAVLKPYVSERTRWIIKHHGVFQMYYYAHHLGGDRHARERFKSHKWYQACAAIRPRSWSFLRRCCSGFLPSRGRSFGNGMPRYSGGISYTFQSLQTAS